MIETLVVLVTWTRVQTSLWYKIIYFKTIYNFISNNYFEKYTIATAFLGYDLFGAKNIMKDDDTFLLDHSRSFSSLSCTPSSCRRGESAGRGGARPAGPRVGPRGALSGGPSAGCRAVAAPRPPPRAR